MTFTFFIMYKQKQDVLDLRQTVALRKRLLIENVVILSISRQRSRLKEEGRAILGVHLVN